MTVNQREAAAQALLSLVTSAYAWTTPPERRLKLWSDVPPATRPACFIFEGGSETATNPAGPLHKATIELRLFVYTDAKDPTKVGSTEINAILAALETALAPAGADLSTGRNTLGGSASWARIEGALLKVPGDLDGDGILVVPIRITLP